MTIRRIREYRIGGRSGFTLIELAIVLAVTSLLTAGLWRMMSSGNTQLRDQAAADQQKELLNAVRGYLASDVGQTRLYVAASKFAIDLDAGGLDAGFASYRPAGFSSGTTNSYGQVYQVRVAKTPVTANTRPTSYSFMIKTVNGAAGESIADTSGGRISSMIGNDGGFVYTTSVCGTGGAVACGAFGSWSSPPTTDYGFVNTAGGQVASRTFVGASAEMNTPWLARLNMDASSASIHELNTIHTTLSMDGNTIYGTTSSDFGGAIEKLETLNLENDDGAALTVNHSTGCSKNQPTDDQDFSNGGCPNIAQFNGDVAVVGLLSATKLYAQQFVYDPSDRRLKHDIKPLTGMLDKFSQIKGYSFRMNQGNDKKFGVIAQELETVFPSLVHEIGDGYKGVDYLGLIGPLVAAVNELKQQNADLKVIVERQGQEIQKIKTKTKTSKAN
ncbi:MAG: tail fiber domain-containing protein [Alphaproteobacteria bacterium]|nr:tail fiber domain-containing protein [Alphaproteobacteria bacterium]